MRETQKGELMLMREEEQIWEKLTNFFADKSVVIAFSGGLDSTVLLEAALEKAKKVLAVFIKTDLIQNEDEEVVKEYTKKRNVELRIFRINLLDNKDVIKNDAIRCYYCKKTLFSKVKEEMSKENFDIVAEGTNFTDLSDYRPGLKAIKELEISSPFIEFGVSKEQIKKIAEYYSFPILKKGATTCLATRIAYNIEITKERLERIEEAEIFINNLVEVSSLRVRDHGDLARIEVNPSAIVKLVEPEIRKKIIETFNKKGFKYITLDLEGYVQGSMNREIQQDTKNE
ncbi:MAG: ATP-dependent sacrificial sulfur transferase LarE [Candidatus Heimdallarchaeaceae archaeon]